MHIFFFGCCGFSGQKQAFLPSETICWSYQKKKKKASTYLLTNCCPLFSTYMHKIFLSACNSLEKITLGHLNNFSASSEKSGVSIVTICCTFSMFSVYLLGTLKREVVQ